MPIDPSIALGYKGIEAPNPLAQYAQVTQIQNAQNQNALNQLQMRAAQRAEQDVESVRNALAGVQYGTPEYDKALTGAYLKTGNVKGLQEYQKGQRETEKAATELQLKNLELQRGIFGNLAQNPSDENIKAHLQDMLIQKRMTEQEANGWLAKTATMNPAQRVALFNNLAQTADQRIGHEVTMRGQNMTDARARERLAAETATGELSPQTIDFVAETYRQTGQLPPLGMGKAAVNMRQKVLDRAAQLAMGTGDKAKTAAEAAADVKTAKADTAAQASAVKDFSSGMSARRVTANNTAINHLATMENLADDLANSDTRVFNAAANAIAKQFGAAAPANFDAARQLVASEVIKAVVANGGGVTERQEAAEQFARANSPAQLKGVINTYKELLGGQLSSLGQQYETGTGRKDFNKKLSPETRKILEKSTPQTGALSAAEQAELEQLRARFKK